MKKTVCLLLAALLLFTLAACGGKQEAPAPEQAAEWTRQGFFADPAGNMLSVTWMDDAGGPGWYVGFMNGEDPVDDSYGGFLQQDGLSLRGTLSSSGSGGSLDVTVTEAGSDGLALFAEGGEEYTFSPMEFSEAPIGVSVNTEGYGFINVLTDGDTYQTSDDYSASSVFLSLYEPATYTLSARGEDGWEFVKWTKDGEDFSAEAEITVEFAESADYVAVFEFPTETYMDPGVEIDLGSSALYTEEDLNDAVAAVWEVFTGFTGCEMHSIRYAGDELCTEENLRWMNELDPEGSYTQVVSFLSDIHSPVEDGPYAWEPDTEYTDYGWWLARSDGGPWTVLTWGYG